MKVVLARVDERLLHGQVIASWSKILEIKKILVIDDKIAIEPFMVQVLEMTAPTGVNAKVITCEDAYTKELQNLNVFVYLQMLSTDPKVEFKK